MAQKHTMKKGAKIVRVIGAFTLLAQFVAVLITAIVAERNENKNIAVSFLVILSAVGALFGAYAVYKDLVEPKLAENISDFTLDDTYDDFDVYADLMGEPDSDDVEEDDE